MKILRVAGDLYPYVLGGIGVHVNDISIEQVQKGHEVDIFTCSPKKIQNITHSDNKGERTYNIHFFKRNFEIAGNPLSFGIVKAIFRDRYSFDIIHAHSHLFFPTVVCALIRRLGSSPLVITNHGTFSMAVPRWLSYIYSNTISVWTFNSADRVICYTEQAKQEMLDLGVKHEKIEIIHNGIYLDKFHQPFHRNSEGLHLLWVGRLNPGKGLKYAIQGFVKFLSTHPNSRLSIAGYGVFYEALNDYITNENLKDKIILLQNVPQEKMPELYASADILVFTSISEGAPRVIYEAMASSLPIICTNLPQLVSVISECGVVIPMRDANAVCDAISKLADSEDLRKSYGKRGRQLAVENYSWLDSVEETTVLFEKLISGGK